MWGLLCLFPGLISHGKNGELWREIRFGLTNKRECFDR